MVLNFFRRDPGGGLEHIEHQVVAMLVDCRHAFDAAMSALVAGADIHIVGEDVRATDLRINAAEQRVRRELVVHVSVHGADDIGSVLGTLLVVKKLERVGDQAKNLYDLAAEGITFVDAPDREVLVALWEQVSGLIGRAAEICADPEPGPAEAYLRTSRDLEVRCNDAVRALLDSDQPGREAVPRALLWRYAKRVVANLSGVVATLVRPLTDLERIGDDTEPAP